MAVRHALGRAVLPGPRRRMGLLMRRSMSADEGTDAKALWEAQVGFGKRVSTKLQESKQLIQEQMESRGFFLIKEFLGERLCNNMREEAQDLFRSGQFYKSFSNQEDGSRIDKKNVYAMELDGHEWGVAPSLLMYTRDLMLATPPLFNDLFPHVKLSNRAYASKLAVSTGGGSKYPRHVDNIGLPDTRKLTFVYYMNPGWKRENGGEIRLFHGQQHTDVFPDGDLLLGFWSDELVHEVLACHDESEAGHRYTQTLWFVTEDEAQIADPNDPHWSALRQQHFSDSPASSP